MAGLGRSQGSKYSVFGAVVAAVLGFFGGTRQQQEQMIAKGHPILAKYLRTQNPKKATGRDQAPYQGYCSGFQERLVAGGMSRSDARAISRSRFTTAVPVAESWSDRILRLMRLS